MIKAASYQPEPVHSSEFLRQRAKRVRELGKRPLHLSRQSRQFVFEQLKPCAGVFEDARRNQSYAGKCSELANRGGRRILSAFIPRKKNALACPGQRAIGVARQCQEQSASGARDADDLEPL